MKPIVKVILFFFATTQLFAECKGGGSRYMNKFSKFLLDHTSIGSMLPVTDSAPAVLVKIIGQSINLGSGLSLKLLDTGKHGSGAFAFILKGELTFQHHTIPVAVKFQEKNGREILLTREAYMYEKLGANKIDWNNNGTCDCRAHCIPCVYYHGNVTDHYDVLIEEFIEHDLGLEFEKSGHKFSRELQLKLFIELLKSFEYIQEHKIIHRDIKPENVMMNHEDNQVILTDFNLAVEIDGRYTSNYPAGSLAYKSPDSHPPPSHIDGPYEYRQTESDDLFSFSYVMGFFGGKDLPWTIRVGDKNSPLYRGQIEEIRSIKCNHSNYLSYLDTLTNDAARNSLYKSFYQYVATRHLDKQSPWHFDYQYYIKEFSKLLCGQTSCDLSKIHV